VHKYLLKERFCTSNAKVKLVALHAYTYMTATLTLSLLTPTMSKYFSDPYITPLATPETKPNTGYERKALTFRATVLVVYPIGIATLHLLNLTPA